MPDTKTSALASLATPDAADLLMVVDVSDTSMAASGTNKRSTVGGLALAESQVTGLTTDLAAKTSVLFTQTADATASAASATSLLGTGTGSATLQAGLLAVGKTIRIRASGRITCTGSQSFQFALKLGSTTLATSANTTPGAATNGLVHVDFTLTCRSAGASGSVVGQGWTIFGASANPGAAKGFVMTSAATIDTTASQAIDLTGTWNATGSSITVTNLTIEALN